MNTPNSMWSVLRRIKMGPIGQCWEWQGGLNAYGYGVVFWGNRQQKAHRMAWIFARGAIPVGMFICHTCDNRKCCNPSHLWLGTNQENSRDRHQKGRSSHGEAHSVRVRDGQGAKLTKTQVVEIRELRKRRLSYREIADKYAISQAHAWRVANQKRWGFIEEPA